MISADLFRELTNESYFLRTRDGVRILYLADTVHDRHGLNTPSDTTPDRPYENRPIASRYRERRGKAVPSLDGELADASGNRQERRRRRRRTHDRDNRTVAINHHARRHDVAGNRHALPDTCRRNPETSVCAPAKDISARANPTANAMPSLTGIARRG